jgi:hypothetical protein
MGCRGWVEWREWREVVSALRGRLCGGLTVYRHRLLETDDWATTAKSFVSLLNVHIRSVGVREDVHGE